MHHQLLQPLSARFYELWLCTHGPQTVKSVLARAKAILRKFFTAGMGAKEPPRGLGGLNSSHCLGFQGHIYSLSLHTLASSFMNKNQVSRSCTMPAALSPEKQRLCLTTSTDLRPPPVPPKDPEHCRGSVRTVDPS